MHHHILACNGLGAVFREHTFDDPEESVIAYLALSREFFQDKITTGPVDIEQHLYDMLDSDEPDAITIGNPAFILAWVPCDGCTNQKMYN